MLQWYFKPHAEKVSIRLRSVGPEKLVTVPVPVVNVLFQSVSGLWDRRNVCCRAGPAGQPLVSIRLRSVGPEKSEGNLLSRS